MRKVFSRACVILLLLFIGCWATLDNTEAADDKADILKEQVVKLWNAKLENDWATVYDMFESSFREKVDKASFLGRQKVHVTKYEIEDVNVTEPESSGVCKVKYQVNQMGFSFDMEANETWIMENGAWKLTYKLNR